MNNEFDPSLTPEMQPPTEESPTPAPEAPKTANKSGFLGELFDYIEIFALSLTVVLFVFTFALRLCRVDGSSMNNTLLNGEQLITTSFVKPKQGDIVVFHLVNGNYSQPLVKRMIADEGQRVRIDLTAKEVYVDGVLLNEPYVYLDNDAYTRFGYFNDDYIYTTADGHIIFEATVPKGHIFAMGDNRNHSSDSRSRGVGFINKDCLLGKAILRLAPFTVFD